jgi:hypothetical protein
VGKKTQADDHTRRFQQLVDKIQLEQHLPKKHSLGDNKIINAISHRLTIHLATQSRTDDGSPQLISRNKNPNISFNGELKELSFDEQQSRSITNEFSFNEGQPVEQQAPALVSNNVFNGISLSNLVAQETPFEVNFGQKILNHNTSGSFNDEGENSYVSNPRSRVSNRPTLSNSKVRSTVMAASFADDGCFISDRKVYYQ